MHRIIAMAVAALAAALIVVAGGPESGTSPSTASAQAPPSCPEPSTPDRDDFVRRIDNPYFPLRPGTTFKYRGRSDGNPTENRVTVTQRTKRIQGVTTTVVRDRAFEDGELLEDTFDWYAQDKRGTVWYFGEDTKEFEDGQVVSTAGSFEAGKDGAKAGIQMPGRPRVGQTLYIEFASGEAEDCFQIADLKAKVRTPYVSSKRALKRKEFTRLEPNLLEEKFFVPGVGLVREQTIRGGKGFTELVSVKGAGRDHDERDERDERDDRDDRDERDGDGRSDDD